MSCPLKDIRLSFQCPADWGKMSQTINGRFCDHCSKEVVDFTGKTEEEFHIIAFEKQGDLCGRFKSWQLAAPPSNSLWKHVAAALALLTGPFSFHLQAQTNTGQNKTTSGDTVLVSEILGNVIYDMPVYKGGNDSLRSFLTHHIRYRKEDPRGRVFATFYVDKSGTVSDVKIVKGLSKEVDAEVKRVVEMLQFEPVNYYPGGKVKYNLPVNFGEVCKKEETR